MNILLISYNDLDKDGRLNELKKVLEHIGNVYVITRTQSHFNSSRIISYHSRKKFDYLSFIRFCINKSSKLKQIDLIVSDNRNCIIPSLVCKKICKCKYAMYDARELYLFNEVESMKSKIGCIIEKLFVPKFDIVTCANRFRAQKMLDIYKLNELPISFENIRKLDYTDISEEACEKKYGYLFSDEKIINIITTSGESMIRKADVLVDAVAKLGNRYRLFLIGYEDKNGHKKIEEICKKNNWNNIVRYKWLSKSELKYFVSRCDIGVVNYSFQNINNIYCASGKLYEFVFEGIPVVTTTNPPLKKICEKYSIGISDDCFYNGIISILRNYDTYKKNVLDFSEITNIEAATEIVANKIIRLINKQKK